MYKTYKLSNAEIKKIYSRPAILIVYLLLALIVFFSSTMFSPTSSILKTTYSGANVQSIYNQFITENIKQDDDTSIVINNANSSIYAVVNLEDKLGEFKTKIEQCYLYFSKNMESPVRKTITNLSNDTATLEQAKNVLIELKNNKVYPIYSYIVSSLSSNINFYLTKEEYENIKKYFNDFYTAIPNNFTGYSKKEFVQRYNILLTNFSFEKNVFPFINKLEKFEINQEYFTEELTNKYITETNLTLNAKLQEIESYYVNNSFETAENYKSELNELIAQYCATAKVASSIINTEIKLAKAGDKTDTYLQNCIDFKDFRRYKLQEDLNINKYIIENNLYEYEILRNFNFNMQSGYQTNMLDFTFFVLQIASIILVLFLIFSIAAIIADEQNKGTIKLVAIRPITRNKILAGKYLGSIFATVIALIITTIASLIFGYVNFGLPTTTSVIISINAGTAISINAYALFLIYVANIIINLLFFGSIAMFFACLTKSNVITIFISAVLYILSLGLVNVFTKYSWAKYLPISNIDLFKFFGNSGNGFLTLGIPPDPNMIFSILSIGITIFILNVISHIIFTSRDLA